ncbi:hypothetical protein A3A09_00715 [Candidatus Nomurabacteria bacterium RIFCSPLOWO2_01_FULL_42_20]|uniref:Homing endonuclease LAGLIDADG domain-containing protein n=1 Tax=Candidatus Nomurabacteria bacterium RIFCSPHIGHO2_01_FULL_42_16 TaxID=1801743 RepID=A0A1F6VHF1_9BACT|nr:MAG: hypothetical protein A2824_00770 [Candidatus Nomurabacteria bacterium RIFCSPHIGHO2_01_FULL_42_16]OGI92287.1 MAG: hypothetical protein A3A09_00715 [Candidatus Nomurabacteria bacterium RIFCSPLOWO2_01_FULL_42_20]
MGNRGTKPKNKVKIKWSPKFAYAIGLLVTDGNLSSDGRHIVFVSKDIEQIKNFLKSLKIKVKIGKTSSGYDGNFSHRVQFGDVIFYKYLESMGLSPAKSKIIGAIDVPDKYFFDFLRGCFDGDGCFYSYWDPRWRSSHMFYVEFVSASLDHIEWLRQELKKRTGVFGHITKDGRKITYQLKYAKKESLEIIKKMYYNPQVVCLSRKKVKIKKALIIEKMQQKKYKQTKMRGCCN